MGGGSGGGIPRGGTVGGGGGGIPLGVLNERSDRVLNGGDKTASFAGGGGISSARDTKPKKSSSRRSSSRGGGGGIALAGALKAAGERGGAKSPLAPAAGEIKGILSTVCQPYNTSKMSQL